jgi:hypothetical protein
MDYKKFLANFVVKPQQIIYILSSLHVFISLLMTIVQLHREYNNLNKS